MNTLLTILAPYSSPINIVFYLMLIACLVFLLLSVLLMTNRILQSFNLRGLLGMICGFIGMVALGTLVFTYVYALKITPVVFEDQKVKFASESIPYKNIRSHYVKPMIQQSRYSAEISTDTSFIFVVETSDRKTHLFSNEHYNMKEMQKVFNQELQSSN